MGGLKCKMCGSNLDIGDSITVCKCEKCGTSQTVPDIEDDKELKLFERAGRLRFNCDFDKAAGIYNTITDSYTEEAEGYWGLILCKYGIEYADNASGKKVPVCHRISYDSVMDDEDFELVMENSDSESRAIFREEAKIIEENRKKYIQIAESEQPYDIYISYRAKDDNGDKTAVSEIAGHLYNKLTSAGYSVFLSEAALKGKKQSDCEPYIYSALNSANVMLALGTSYDDYNDVWVKNEWNRYLEIAEKNKNKCLIPCYKDVDEYDIPKEFAGLKVCQLGNDDTFNNIMAEIANVVKPESVNQPAPEPEKAEPAEEIELEEIEIIEPVDINKLLDEGFSAISDKNWKEANKLFFQVLDEEPDNSKAYANLSNSEAEYQKDHDSWEYERDNLEEARQQWVKDVEEKQKEHDEWLAVNGVAIEEWNAKKKEYNDNKQKLEYELKRLQEDKGFIEGFMAGAKAAKKDKEIMNVRIELSRLALPKEPIMPKEPVIPPEPALRREPEKPDYDIMIGRNDVLDTFRSLMA